MAAASVPFDVPTSLPKLQIFPEYSAILNNFIADPETGVIGSEPSTLIDSVLFLGFFILSTHKPSLPPKDETFTSILQRLSLLSANIPTPTLRYHAHILTSELLHSHPSNHVRLAFIKDTLEHCPYENLKASAVEWLKDEILATNANEDESSDIFSTPTALTTLAPLLFPDLQPTSSDQTPQEETHHAFRAHQSFYLAVLNFYYLLLSSPSLFSRLEIKRLTEDYNVREGYLQGLSAVSSNLRKDLGDEEQEAVAELGLLDMTVERVTEAMVGAGLGG